MGWNRYWTRPAEASPGEPQAEAHDGDPSLTSSVVEDKGKNSAEVLLVEDVSSNTSDDRATKTKLAATGKATREQQNKARRLYSRQEPTYDDLEEALGGREVLDESELPFIHPDEIAKHNSRENGIWIVVEDRVYDCTDFLDKFHPGSPETILAFAGKQCTWQFWKFHNKRHLKMWSSSLLIGWTDPPPNPFPEPPRWIRTH